MERINENGIRELFCEADGKWYPDTVHENGRIYILDERPDRFQYYEMSRSESREEVMQNVIASEEMDLTAPEMPWEKQIADLIAENDLRSGMALKAKSN